MLGMAKVCLTLFVCNPRVTLSVSVSVSFLLAGGRSPTVGLVFRISDGTLVCLVTDLVPRCCSSAEHERGREGGGNQKQKKSCGFRGCSACSCPL